jgi:hypothetical protein
MDIPHQEARLHSGGKFETPAVHNSRIVGVVNRQTGEFTPHKGYDPQQPSNNPVRPETHLRGKIGPGGGVPIPQPTASPAGTDFDIFTQRPALSPDQYTQGQEGIRVRSTAGNPVPPRDPQADESPLVEADKPAPLRVSMDDAIARYRAGEWTTEDLDRYALERSFEMVN